MLRHRLLKWFWAGNFPVCLGLYLYAADSVTLLYLALVSIYANFASEASVEQAARARLEVERDGQVQERETEGR